MPNNYADTKNTTIGWIGTGIMGRSMCGHLVKAGYKAVVYNRSKDKAADLLAAGATWADTPKAVAEAADVTFTIVGFPKDVREVYFAANGVLAGAKPGSVIIDMTTTSPTLAKEIHTAAQNKNIASIDAPVSGGDVGARNATLSIMAGGDESAFQSALPLFQLMGKNIALQGGPGSGQHTKMCNQIVIAGTMIGVCESLVYAKHAGLDPATMLAAISKGAAGCWTLDNLAPRIVKGDFAPGFMIEHFIKDLNIALEEAQHMNLDLPGTSLVQRLYALAAELGYARNGTHALMFALDK